ncbi:hypothetical protein IWQ60_003693 [Tieghemiomyces parasiticus]|uniref:CBM1 domain-containing protein n=1 Tax=Tieghemiomyces parasiticus TaxID=78921 RepID=A0A9W8AHF5_9FUNG|nr:hypothetical protein IWQ60_003693 [Tieghemiomyces parasiticus]
MQSIRAVLFTALFALASVSARPQAPHAPSACVSGTMTCGGNFAGGFTVCNWGSPVSFACAPGTKCYPNGNYIICNR